MLDKLQKRWQDTGVYDQLCEYKEVMSEPRGGDRAVDFDELMGEFYDCISRTEHVGKCLDILEAFHWKANRKRVSSKPHTAVLTSVIIR